MAVKIFAKVSYNINGVASPSFIMASAFTDELNEINSDAHKILSFSYYQKLPFFMETSIPSFYQPTAVEDDFSVDKSLEEVFRMFGLPDNEKYPSTSYFPIIGFLGSDIIREKSEFIMNNLANAKLDSIFNIEPAKVFFYIHKLTTAEIDSFADSHPALNTVNASVTDLYDLLLPHVATKNDALEADGYRQATQNGNAIVFYADCIAYYPTGVFNPKEAS